MTADAYQVIAPTLPGDYHKQYGWRVVVCGDNPVPDGWTAYSGDERGARNYARKMNRRLRDERRQAREMGL